MVTEVRDTGEGMSAEVQKKLFSPFFTTKPIGIGTGLGLSICQRIVTSLDGRITVESEEGKGSVFRVHLPRAQAVAQPSLPPSVRSEPPPSRRAAVLAIDDEPSLLLAVARALSREHDVTQLVRARDAVQRIQGGQRYDVIICDLMMPEMTGMELHAELLRIAPDQAQRMIFLTAAPSPTAPAPSSTRCRTCASRSRSRCRSCARWSQSGCGKGVRERRALAGSRGSGAPRRSCSRSLTPPLFALLLRAR